MTIIRVASTNSARRRLSKLLRIAALGIGIGAGGVGFASIIESSTEYSMKREIETALSEDDYGEAVDLFTTYTAKDLLDPRDEALLRDRVAEAAQKEEAIEQRTRLTSNIRSALDRYDVDLAKQYLENVDVTLGYEALAGLHKTIYDHTDEGLYNRIRAANSDVRETLMDDYLKFYPEGLHILQVTRYRAIDSYSGLLEKLNRGESYTSVMEEFISLGSLLEEYPSVGEDLSLDELTRAIENYQEVVEVDVPLSIGSRVRVIASNSERWDYRFENERNSAFPIGSIGKIVMVEPDGDYCVEFEGLSAKWSGEYKYSCADPNKPNRAGYEIEGELQRVGLNYGEKKRLEIEYNRLAHIISTGERMEDSATLEKREIHRPQQVPRICRDPNGSTLPQYLWKRYCGSYLEGRDQ